MVYHFRWLELYISGDFYFIICIYIAPFQVTGENADCVFWDFEIPYWSQEGCQLVTGSADKRVICHCYHLTNFAVLVVNTKTIKYNWIDSSGSLMEVNLKKISLYLMQKLFDLLCPVLRKRADVLKTYTVNQITFGSDIKKFSSM